MSRKTSYPILLRSLAILLVICAVGFALTASTIIATSAGLVFTFIMTMSRMQMEKKRDRALLGAIPEIIDHIISGTQSGLSLSESLASLAQRGPEISKEIFRDFEVSIKEGKRFEEAVEIIQNQFSYRSADQLFDALLFAHVVGGSELVDLLKD